MPPQRADAEAGSALPATRPQPRTCADCLGSCPVPSLYSRASPWLVMSTAWATTARTWASDTSSLGTVGVGLRHGRRVARSARCTWRRHGGAGGSPWGGRTCS